MENPHSIEDMYSMKLHDQIELKECSVLRVVGGWIYSFIRVQGINPASFSTHSIFVEYKDKESAIKTFPIEARY